METTQIETKQYLTQLSKSGNKYLEALKSSKGQFKNMLPEIREAEERSSMLKAQTDLANSIESVVNSIQKEIDTLNNKIWSKKYPKLDMSYLLDNQFMQAFDQTSIVLELISTRRTEEQILFYLNQFIKAKQFDAVFWLYDNLNLTNSYKDKNLMDKIEPLIKKVKTDLGITELEDRLKLFQDFIPNVSFFLSVLKGEKFNLGNSLIRELNMQVKIVMREIFPELYDYLFKQSYSQKETV
jgi:hypothetical protein